MVPLPLAEPSEFNAFGTIARSSPTQNQMDLLTNMYTQTIFNSSIIPQNDTDNAPRINTAQTNDQSSVILQQFSMIAEKLKNFTNKVSGDIMKTTQAYNTSHERKGKLIENAISQALTKAQNIIHQLTQ